MLKSLQIINVYDPQLLPRLIKVDAALTIGKAS